MFQLAVLVSGGGTNLQALCDRIADGRLPGVQIACVVASRPDCQAIERARRCRLPVHVVDRKAAASQAAFDQALLGQLKAYPLDLVVLAGFLCLLGPTVVAAYEDRIINIHPSLIPSFCGPGYYGIKPHQAVLAAGATVTGATVHLVDQDYDTGPILLQQAVPVLPGDSPQSLQQRVMTEAEQPLLAQAISLFAQGRVRKHGRQLFIVEGDKQP